MDVSQERKQELGLLLQQMREKPSHNWDNARERAIVLTHMLARKTR